MEKKIKTSRLILFGFLINYLFTAIYQPFISPLTFWGNLSSNQFWADYGIFLLCIPLTWVLYGIFIFGIFPTYCVWAIERTEIFFDIGVLLPIFVSVLMLLDLVLITYFILSGKWRHLTQKTKFCLIIVATICFNWVCFDCCAFSMRA